jgi:microcystin-dependent protein
MEALEVGILPGASNPANVNKFPATNGQDPATISWTNVTAAYLASNAVTAAKIAAGAVTTAKIANAAVNSDKILPDSVNQTHMADDSIGTPQLQDGSVNGDKIAEGTITGDKIGEGEVSAENITDETITTAEMADSAITTPKIADEAVTADKMADNTITRTQLATVLQTPIGMIAPIAVTAITAISGWLFCNGQEVNRATYALLFTGIGTTYGAGDGENTFNLPDLRGRGLFGVDMSVAGTDPATGSRITTATASALTVGGNGGVQQVTLDETQIPEHSHSYNGNNGSAGVSGFAAVNALVNPTALNTGVSGGGLPHNNMSPFMLMQFIIYAGV